ncbi:MAG: tetratricopeptide repeat protein, partial [Candidatus Omnitrophota bacterium]
MTLTRHIFFNCVCFFCVFFSIGICGEYSYALLLDGAIEEERTEAPEIKNVSSALTDYIMGAIYDNFGSIENAVAEYRKSLEYRSDIGETYRRLGSDLLLQGDLDEAIAMIRKAKELDPEDIKAYLLLGIIYTARGELDKAQVFYEDALKVEPENLKVMTFLSDLFVIQQKLESAAEVYEAILKIKKDDPFIFFNLG